MQFRAAGGVALLALLLGLATGCRGGKPAGPPPGAPVVPVSHPVQRDVIENVEYTGRTDAVESVGIRARVTGYLIRAPFREGAEVKKGALLFEIDPRPYRAQLTQAESQVKVNEAGLKLAQANYERAKETFGKGAAPKQDVDQTKAAVEQAAAQIEATKATVELYRLNLGYTEVAAPIDGQVSRYYYTLGNLINQDQTLLTTIVSVDPMYAYFDMDERTILRIRSAINQGKIKARRISVDLNMTPGMEALAGGAVVEGSSTELPVLMGLDGEDGYPHRGTLNFVNNVVNPSTGTVAVRGVFANPLPPNGRRLLSPGMFVRIRLPIGQPAPALLVVDRAIGSDQGLKYVYVIDDQKKVQYRRVKTGVLQDDGLRVIEEGIKPDEWVVVGALQQLRPGMDADPEPTQMPTPGAPTPPPSAAPAPKKDGPPPNPNVPHAGGK